MIDLLGKMRDTEISSKFDYSVVTIRRLRRRLGISSFRVTKQFYNCSFCGNSSSRYINKDDSRNKTNKFYCSKQCYDKARIKDIVVVCDYCHKEVHKKPYSLNRGHKYHFCNSICSNKYNVGKNSYKWKHIDILCSYCGKKYQLVKNRVEKHKNHFCSSSCLASWITENWRGEGHPRWIEGYVPFYGYGWGKLTKEVRNRDKGCMSCGELDGRLDVHHIVPYRISKDNSLDNLILLCDKCHVNLENLYRKIEVRPKYWENINSMKLEVK